MMPISPPVLLFLSGSMIAGLALVEARPEYAVVVGNRGT